jgi:ATP/maltotriose-dependent transcriptional regulator MalT
MKRTVLVYGVIGGVLITVLQWSQYRFLVMEHSLEVYGGLTAATFAVLGIWLGMRLRGARSSEQGTGDGDQKSREQGIGKREQKSEPPLRSAKAFVLDEKRREGLGITRREMEVLELIAQGMSNQEIAAKLFVSENTVKTHLSRVFDKLGAKRRTQAVQMGKEMGLLP